MSSRVIAGFLAMIRHPKSFVDSDDHVEIEDNNFDDEVEDVEACFRLISGGVSDRSLATGVIDASSEACAKAEQEG